MFFVCIKHTDIETCPHRIVYPLRHCMIMETEHVSENLDCYSEILSLVTQRDFMTLTYCLLFLHSVFFIRFVVFRISCSNPTRPDFVIHSVLYCSSNITYLMWLKFRGTDYIIDRRVHQ
jgi:hypothetical protein